MKNFDALLSDIKAKKYAPIYFFCGEEEYYIDRLTEAIEQTVIPESERAFNLSILYGKDVTAQIIIETCGRLPMMSDRQVVVVREAQSFSEISKIESYIKKPAPSTILVFAYKHGKPDMRKSIFKEIKSKAIYAESEPLRDYQMNGWVTQWIKSKGYKINERALEIFVESVGTDLSTVTNEIEKIIINKAAGSEITVDDIERGVGVSREYNVFELNHALGQRDATKALKIIHHFAANPKNGPLVLVLGMLQRFYLQLFAFLHNKGKQDSELASLLKVNPYFIKDYRTASSKYNDQSLRRVFYILEEYDLRSKGVNSTNSMGDGELMKEMVARILAA